jgi:hypothetical protein
VRAIRPSRATASLVAVALLAASGLAVVQVRSEAIAAEEAERRAAEHELDRDVYALRTELVTPAHAAERSAAELLVTVVETVTGSERDAETIGGTLDALIADLRTAADQLDEAAAQPMPSRPQAVPVQTADPIFGRLEVLEGQASEVAAQLRHAADEAEVFSSAAHELSSAAATYAASTDELPSSDDPAVLADAWRAEDDRLDAYRAAVDRAAETPGLEELSSSHEQLIDTMRTLADDAVTALDEGDVDGYNALLADVLGDENATSLPEELVAATESALETTTLTELQDARTAALELLIDLEDLRRVTGPSVAG